MSEKIASLDDKQQSQPKSKKWLVRLMIIVLIIGLLGVNLFLMSYYNRNYYRYTYQYNRSYIIGHSAEEIVERYGMFDVMSIYNESTDTFEAVYPDKTDTLEQYCTLGKRISSATYKNIPHRWDHLFALNYKISFYNGIAEDNDLFAEN